MLGMLALMAVTLAGADETMCTTRVEEAVVAQLMADAEADLYEAEVYADAQDDFDARLEEVGLAGSTLGREEARAMAGTRDDDARFVARNR